MTTRISRRAIACALLTTTALSLPAIANAETPAPKFVSIDDHGVDLTNALPFLSIEEGGIGSGPGRISMQRIWAEGAGFVDNWTGGLYDVTSGGVIKKYVQFAGYSSSFSGSGLTWTSDKADGATLIFNGTGHWVYTARDGTQIVFRGTAGERAFNCPGSDPKTCDAPATIVRPDGLQFSLTWELKVVCINHPGEPCAQEFDYWRLKNIASSAGYSAAFTYLTNTAPANMGPDGDWYKRTSVTFDNSANHPATLPTITYARPSSTELDVTDPASRQWVFTLDGSGQLTGVKRPGSASNNVSYTYTSGLVTAATKDGVTNNYSRSVVGTTGTLTVTNPLSQTNVIVSDLNIGRPTSFQDGLSHTTAYQYDSNGRLTRTTAPEGNYTQLAYDARGNVTTTTNVAKSGSGLSNIVTSASFDTSCSNVVKCNKPNTTTDAKGNVTDYSYDATHGGVTSVKSPAPTGGADRPETRLSYTQVTSASGDLVYMLTGSSACASGVAPACVGTANESKASASYNSNLLPTSVSKGDGTGALTATSAMTYDPRGNLLTVDGPLSGTADTTAFKYDAADQRTGVISPDPDGAGSLPNRAVRLTYRSDGQVSKQELGTTAGQSDANFAAMSVAQTVDLTFDSNNRRATSKLSAGGTNYALTQTSYDALGRVDCTTVRMNPAIYGSLPASACTLGTAGSFGPDRISQNVYDAAGEVTQLKVAVGTSDAATERTLTYTNNGVLATLKDAEANLTTYEYDGFDRLQKTRFPVSTKGANSSSTTDYEQLGYDANGNVTSRRLRDASSIAFTFDNLDRVTLKDLPGSELDVTYGYDNLSRPTSASQTGNALSFTYDALSRKLTEVGPQGTASFAFDLADERTQVTYPTGGTSLAIDYAYLTTGELSTIKQSATTLASYGYDNLGGRTSVTFANGASQAFTYDPVERLASLSNDLSGTSNDLSVTFGYNPASQLTSNVRTGDAYAFTGHANQATVGTSNGLNQLTAYGAKSLSHDSKGNVTAFGSETFGYSSEDLMTSGPNSTSLAYDPMLRLYQTSSGSTTSRFAYDGVKMLAEYNGSNALQRRWVYDDAGQPVVQYEGTGTASTDRRYLSQDERGSIIATSDSSSASLGINSYDDYGMPGASNIGRFGYTGQPWLPEVTLNAFPARMYEPETGRFLQTDPIGYEDSPNLYGYVLDDPVNLVDPSGTECLAIDVGYSWYTKDGKYLGPAPGSYFVPVCFSNSGGGAGGGGNVAGGGGGGGGPAIVITGTRQKRLTCTGSVQLLAGNLANIGKQGFPAPYPKVRFGSAAVVPSQFTGVESQGPLLRAIGASSYGFVYYHDTGGRIGFEAFFHIDQAVGNKAISRAAIVARGHGNTVIEIVGGTGTDYNASGWINMPDFGQGCPGSMSAVGQ